MGGRQLQEQPGTVVVDVREFRSALPCMLHQARFRIAPLTLEVGDYVLSPTVCVERKSVSDLFSSFSSGRLHHQAEMMVRHYAAPALLIEFDPKRPFSLLPASELGHDISPASVCSKLVLLVRHFPKLRILWSRSPHATVSLFAALKVRRRACA